MYRVTSIVKIDRTGAPALLADDHLLVGQFSFIFPTDSCEYRAPLLSGRTRAEFHCAIPRGRRVSVSISHLVGTMVSPVWARASRIKCHALIIARRVPFRAPPPPRARY